MTENAESGVNPDIQNAREYIAAQEDAARKAGREIPNHVKEMRKALTGAGENKDQIKSITKEVMIDGEKVVCLEVDSTKEYQRLKRNYPHLEREIHKVALITARQATTQEIVKTGQDGTQNIAEVGDWIIENPGEDPYVFGDKDTPLTERQKKFAHKYTLAPGSTNRFEAKYDGLKGIPVDRNIVFMTNWGEEMAVLRGGYLTDKGYSISNTTMKKDPPIYETKPIAPVQERKAA